MKKGSLKIGSNVILLYKIDIKEATVFLQKNCDISDWSCNNCDFSQQLWVVLRYLWLIATIVNTETIVNTSGAPYPFSLEIKDKGSYHRRNVLKRKIGRMLKMYKIMRTD